LHFAHASAATRFVITTPPGVSTPRASAVCRFRKKILRDVGDAGT
jgi:hypothetical protein